MSSMVLFTVKDNGDVVRCESLRNSWLGAALVWTKLGEKYLGKFDPENEFKKSKMSGNEFDPFGWKRTWDLQHNPKIEQQDWVVLMSTFDNIIIPRNQMLYVADHFEVFNEEFPSHFGACAHVLRQLYDEGSHGFAIQATTVSENPWWIEEEGEYGHPYNVKQGTKHWFFDPNERARLIKEATSSPQ
jgi:hypothetical protein